MYWYCLTPCCVLFLNQKDIKEGLFFKEEITDNIMLDSPASIEALKPGVDLKM